jgi:acetyl-CoA carboxylase carboxyl transferase subunit beta
LLYGFAFIGGSMGAVGEKNLRGIDYSIKVPFVMISKSGGARMMAAFIDVSKTSAKLAP